MSVNNHIVTQDVPRAPALTELIAEYNAGSLNIDAYLRRLIALSKDLSEEEMRAATENLLIALGETTSTSMGFVP